MPIEIAAIMGTRRVGVWPYVGAKLRLWKEGVSGRGKGTDLNLEVGVEIVGGRGGQHGHEFGG